MRRALGLLLSGSFFFAPAISWGQQVSSVPAASDSDRPASQNIPYDILPQGAADCSRLLDAARAARQAVESDRRLLAAADLREPSADKSAGPFPSDLPQDLSVLQQRTHALHPCS